MKKQPLGRGRLDRFISEKCQISRRDVRMLLAQKRVTVDGSYVDDIGLIIDKFSTIVVDDKVLQAQQARYLMLHKPTGVVSATKDEHHKTVLDLIDGENYQGLHLVGRLDLNTSGLVLLTNDSRWSEQLTLPDKKVAKTYWVRLAKPLTVDYVEAFANGMYFHTEDITTRPAMLEIVSEYVARVTLVEGRYHQIKRMFGRFQNQVIELHRESIGKLKLDSSLAPGDYRPLTAQEVVGIFP
ncbi:pseudouridine synthase [Thalassotalea sp. PLHSN55]|uniref:pseudouridine synthase n=1 Tax=Thalassotalea sp. PLHSN55 TaxID=3435888 RepID=UPI003F836333